MKSQKKGKTKIHNKILKFYVYDKRRKVNHPPN